jgi:predicted RNA-binding protein with TRAM domain
LGHTPSGWIIDEPATLDADGSKHIECLICGEILQTVAIKRLKAEDYTDNTGKANVGGYTIIVTDKNAAPVPHARAAIDVENKITVELPDGRLLDYSDQTTVTVLFAETGEPVPGLNITVVDKNGNAAIGVTDENGQITVPSDSTNTGGNGNGTIGGGNDGEDDDNGGNSNGEGNGGYTYVVTVTDKNSEIIDNCIVSIDSGGKITVELPNGIPFDRDNPITVTIANNEGNPQAGLEVTITDGEKTETGVTDNGGKVTLPETDRGYTNDAGKIKVNGYIVIVENVDGAIAKAFVTHTEENQITVLLPEPYILTVDNQTTVTVLRSENETPVFDMLITVFDYQNRNVTDLTDIHGKVTVPPLDRGYTDDNGIVRIYGYIVKVENIDVPIKGAYVTHTSDDESVKPQINILLPGTHILTLENQTTVTVLFAADETPFEGMTIEVSDYQWKIETDITDKDGKIIVPPANAGSTDEDGKVKVNGYIVLIEDTKTPIENAFVNYTEDSESGNPQIAVELPDSHTLDENNQTTVTVLLKSDNSPVNGISVTVTDNNDKTATKTTNSSGKITVPDKTPSKSGGGGGGSSYTSSSGGSYSAITNIVTVTDKDGNAVKNPTVMINSSVEITVKLPSGYIIGVGNLDNGNWYTVTVKSSNSTAKPNVKVTLSDNDENSAIGYTDSEGKVILPKKTHTAYIYGYPDYNFRPENGLTRAEAAAIFARLLSERKNEEMTPLPAFADISPRDWHASAIGYLQSYGILNGYNDGTFRPDIQITRAEFVTMSVRFYNAYDKTLANTAGNSITLTDISGCWAETSIKTALDYGWIQGYADGTFRGENNITRAEVVTLINRTTGRKPDIDYIAENFPSLIRFYDVPTSHWAFFSIIEAANTHEYIQNTTAEVWRKK